MTFNESEDLNEKFKRKLQRLIGDPRTAMSDYQNLVFG